MSNRVTLAHESFTLRSRASWQVQANRTFKELHVELETGNHDVVLTIGPANGAPWYTGTAGPAQPLHVSVTLPSRVRWCLSLTSARYNIPTDVFLRVDGDETTHAPIPFGGLA